MSLSASVESPFRHSAAVRRRDWHIILLIGLAHAVSHSFQLVLPSLYLPLAKEFGLDFARLGLLVSCFYVLSSAGQACLGFVVDRVGARPMLWFGLGSFVVSGLLIGSATGYASLMAAAVLGGLANSVFHPVDYSLLNHHVTPPRLGHAFSIHNLSGTLGWAVTPVLITSLTMWASWRVAVFCVCALAAVILLLTILKRGLLTEAAQASPAPRPTAAPKHAGGSFLTRFMTLLSYPGLWLSFLFFVFFAIALSAVQNYTIPVLSGLYGLSHVAASSALSGYMGAAAAGMAAGGFFVAATPRTERTVAVALLLAGLTLVVLALGWTPRAWAPPVLALAGFCAGVASPSRDMLIRRIAPKGNTGSVYGLVYSGMDVGSALGPIGFGLLLTVGPMYGPWLGAGLALAVSVLLAQRVAVHARRGQSSLEPCS